MFTALLLVLANPHLDTFDDANLALTSCGFAAHREANAANRSLADFKGRLASRCAAEIRGMRTAIVALGRSRGKGTAAAQAAADDVIARFHANFVGQYARRAEIDARMKALAEALEKEGIPDAE